METCLVCRREFQSSGRRRYCSDACKQRSYRKVGVRLPWKKMPKPKGCGPNDCVPAAISYAIGKEFSFIKKWLVDFAKEKRHNWRDNGFSRKTYGPILSQLGFKQVKIEKGTLVHDGLLEEGRVYLVSIKHHMFAVIDRTAFDLWDAQRKYLKRATGLWVREY